MNNMTITVDIIERELLNLLSVSMTLNPRHEEINKQLFEAFPFTIYKERMVGKGIVTIQIPIKDYCLYLSEGLVK